MSAEPQHHDVDRTQWHAKAILLGERIDTRNLGDANSQIFPPVTIQLGPEGTAFIFRYGVVVLIGFDPKSENLLLDTLNGRVTGREPSPTIEEVSLLLDGRDRDTLAVCGRALVRCKYMLRRSLESRRRGRHSCNHTAGNAGMDVRVVSTTGFRLLFVMIIIRYQHRRLILKESVCPTTSIRRGQKRTDFRPSQCEHSSMLATTQSAPGRLQHRPV
jgi:hypothetical protein